MSSVSTFDSTKTGLQELLTSARKGEAQLPDFQRGWVWDDNHISDLIASVSRSFPIGTVMMLQTGGEVNFRTRPIEGAAPPAKVQPAELILDGQQRLTSLFQALVSGKPVATRDPKGNPIDRWYYLDIAKSLDPWVEREDAILSMPADRMVKTDFGRQVVLDLSTPEREYEQRIFPLSQVFEHNDWWQGLGAHHAFDSAVMKQWAEFQSEIIQKFLQYQLPVIRLHRETPKEAVCLVFEKVNTGGVSLTVFELLTATFAAVAPPDFDLRSDWEAREKRLHQRRVLREVANTDFLQALTLLVTHERQVAAGAGDEDRTPISCKRRDMLKVTFEEYQRWADRLTEGFERVAHFLHRERIFDTRFLPYGTQLVPLAAALTLLGDEGLERPRLREKLARWYWCGVFGELYGSATESRFARDLPDLLAAAKDDAFVPRSVAEANLTPERLVALRSRQSAAYKGVYVLLVREGARDFRTGDTSTDQNYFDEAVDIHHIFPKKWCNERRPDPIEPARYDSIVNKTPLTARTNRIIGGDAPSVYLTKLADRQGVPTGDLTANLASHFIDPALLRADNFDEFFDRRRQALLDRIGVAMGKAPVPDPTEPAAAPYVEPPDDLDA
jgi:hypothetical protein